MWHCEVRDGLLVMNMSSMVFCLIGVVIICSVWVVRSMFKKRLLMSTGYECPCRGRGGGHDRISRHVPTPLYRPRGVISDFEIVLHGVILLQLPLFARAGRIYWLE